MRWSFKIGKVGGTEIRIHLTLLLLLVWLGASTARGGAPMDAFYVVALICLVFVCVLLHEFGTSSSPSASGSRLRASSSTPIGAIVDENGVLRQWLTLENADDLIQTRAATHDFVVR